MKKLSVIVVIFNELEEFKKCYKSIKKNQIPNMEILVVDNGGDKKKEILKIGKDIKYIMSGGNIGFGNAANVGINKSDSEYVLVLTPDIELFPDTIKKTVEYSDKNPKVGFTTCGLFTSKTKISYSIYHTFPNLFSTIFEYNYFIYFIINKLRPSYHPLLYPLKELNKPLSVKHVTGAYVLLKRKMLKKVGMFDSDYIFYREETDLCRRIINHGWEIHFVPFGGVYHSAGGALHQKFTQSNKFYLESTYKYFNKYNGKFYMFIIWLSIFVSSIASIVFLSCILGIKKIFNKKSKSAFLLKEWINVVKWHLQNFKILTI